MDLSKLSVIHTASKKMEWLAERQKVVAENVANADTPRFKAKETDSFETFLGNAKTSIGTNITNSKHISSRGGSALRIVEDQYAWTQKPNGNTVSLEQQTIKSAEIRDMHGLATTLYKKSYAMYKTAIGGN